MANRRKLTNFEASVLAVIAKRPRSAMEIWQLCQQQKLKHTELQIIEMLLDLELAEYLTRDKNIYSVINFIPAETFLPGEKKVKDQSRPAREISPTIQNGPSKTEKSPGKTDQKDQSAVSSENVPTTPMKCPGCDFTCEKLPSSAERPRKKCPKCGRKSELKFWTRIQKDQKPTASEKPPQNRRTIADDPKIPVQTAMKDQSAVSSEKVPTTSSTQEFLKGPVIIQILQKLGEGLFASRIAKDLRLSQATISRILQKLVKRGILVPYKSYPKTYRIVNPEFQPPTSPKNQSTLAPYIDEFHKIKWAVPLIEELGRDIHHLYDAELFDAYRNTKLQNWTKYIYNMEKTPGFKELADWEFEVGTKQVIIIYRHHFKPFDQKNPLPELEQLQRQIPFEFLSRRKLPFLPDKVHLHKSQPHIVVKFNDPYLDSLGVSANIQIKNGKAEVCHVDNSDDTPIPGLEFVGEDGLKLAMKQTYLPDKVDALTNYIKTLVEKNNADVSQMKSANDKLATSVNNLTEQLGKFIQLLTPQVPQPMAKGPSEIGYI